MSRYRGSLLGVLWSFIHPLFMLSVYMFVFSIIFKAKWGTEDSSKIEFALILFAGLILFNFFAECLHRAPTVIINNSNFVKKVVFPLETLAFISVGSSLFQLFTSLMVWLTAYALAFGRLNPTVLLLPFVLFPVSLIALGASWFLASLCVFFRDTTHLTHLAITVLMFLSPFFSPLSAVPEKYRVFISLNPIAMAISQLREILFWGRGLDLDTLLPYYIFSFFIAWIGFLWFQLTRRWFADVI
jgi:lipopolysaccharide transport system permease protein